MAKGLKKDLKKERKRIGKQIAKFYVLFEKTTKKYGNENIFQTVIVDLERIENTLTGIIKDL